MKPPLLVLPLLLSACAAPAAPAPAEGGVTVSASLAVAELDGRRVLAAVTPWTSGQIHHAVVTLYPAAANSVSVAEQPVTQANMAKKVVFTNLKPGTGYRIVVTAYAADGVTDPIHDTDEAKSTTAFTTTYEPVHTLADGIKLTLRNKTFSGATAGNTLTVVPGQVTHSGSESVSIQ